MRWRRPFDSASSPSPAHQRRANALAWNKIGRKSRGAPQADERGCSDSRCWRQWWQVRATGRSHSVRISCDGVWWLISVTAAVFLAPPLTGRYLFWMTVALFTTFLVEALTRHYLTAKVTVMVRRVPWLTVILTPAIATCAILTFKLRGHITPGCSCQLGSASYLSSFALTGPYLRSRARASAELDQARP